MSADQKLSEKEFSQMIRLLKRYVTTEMDHWELWTFDTEFSKIYVNISMKPFGSKEAYSNLNNFIEQPNEPV